MASSRFRRLARQAFPFGVSISQPGMRGDEDSFKVRRGKVSGYVDHFTAEERKVPDGMVHERPHRALGHSRTEERFQPASSSVTDASPLASLA